MNRLTQNVLCAVMIIYNLLYLLLIVCQTHIAGLEFNPRVLDIPAVLFGLIIFPMVNLYLLLNRQKLIPIDFSFPVMLPALWLLIVPGGSFTNFVYVNPALIGTVSSLYLLRFRFRTFASGTKSVMWVKVLLLWLVITGILTILTVVIPVLPE